MRALARDAEENGHIWNLQDRLEIHLESRELVSLIWAHETEEMNEFESLVNGYRKTPPSDGIPVTWAKKPIA